MHDRGLPTGLSRLTWVPALALFLFSGVPGTALAEVDEDKSGAWYIHVWSLRNPDRRVGFQGDIQHRNWDLGGDLEQLLIRGAVSLQPENARARFAFGAAHVISGAYGPDNSKSREDRVYQEMTLPGRVGEKFYLTHRFRFEQRWVDDQAFRTRLRYLFGVDIPLNRARIERGALYLSLYNELFLNSSRRIGDGRRVDEFDRNRLYLGVGKAVSDRSRLQFGYMHQQTATVGKGQLQVTFLRSL